MERAQDSIFFRSRDQLVENAPARRRQSQMARNAPTISARETNSWKLATRSHVLLHLLFLLSSPFATPLEIPLADSAILLQDHSQMTCPARATSTSWPR
jgi:hypothetical protein